MCTLAWARRRRVYTAGNVDEATTAAAGLAELVEAREQAEARVYALEAEARASARRAADASATLAEFERRGGRPAERDKLEAALAEARAQAAEPWAERVSGARAAVRDADAEVRRFAGEHFAELVAGLEADGRLAAEHVDRAAEEFIRATERRAEAERNLISTVALTRRLDPNDVARSRADEAVAAVTALLQRGGEAAPVLRVRVPADAAA
jgi:hypothetical protein